MIDRIIDIVFTAIFSKLLAWAGKMLSRFFKSQFFDEIKLKLFVAFLGFLACGCIFATLLLPKIPALHITLAILFCTLSVCQYRMQKAFSKWALEKLLVELFIGGIAFSVVLSKLSEAVR